MIDPPTETRIAAYAYVQRNGELLLTRLSPWENDFGRWTLPGGGLDWGEDPVDALHRELWEETGLRGTIEELLGIDSVVYPGEHRRNGRSLHHIRIIYRVSTDGVPRVVEEDGSTDDVSWVPLDELGGRSLVDLVGVARGMAGGP